MNLKQSLIIGSQTLKNTSTPELDTELILCHVLQKPKTFVITNPDDELTAEQQLFFETLIKQRANGKPIAYITNSKEFFGREFFVDERVLIPRPETEEMVEDAIKYLKSHPEVRTIIDLGTGSGCIAITIAKESSQSADGSNQFKIYGLEISEEAIKVAKKNHEHYPCENLELIHSDLLSKLPTPKGTRWVSNSELPTLILANLPYIGTTSNNFISDETERYEPHQALFGGADGLEMYRRTWQQIKEKKMNVSALFMEIGFSQAEQMEKEAKEAFPEMSYELKYDLAGLPRTAILKK